MAARVIEVVQHDPSWSVSFSEARMELLAALGDIARSTEHIGSTAVPGPAAKPTIDMLLEVDRLDRLDMQRKTLEAIGYVARGENGIPGRRYYTRGGPVRSHHLHAFKSGDPHLLRHRAFRDHLIQNPAAAKAYGTLKKRAAAECRKDSSGYAAAKQAFIDRYQRIALHRHDAPA